MSTITIIGAGNVATVLAKRFITHHHSIIQIIHRDKLKGQTLANAVQAKHFDTSLQSLQQNADFYIIAVSDNAIAEVAQQLHIENGILLHTAGAVDMQVLQNAATQYGVLYPLQSLQASMQQTPTIPFLVEGNTQLAEQTIYKWATTFSQTVQLADSDYRLRMHLAAVLASNFSNHLYTLTNDYCKHTDIDFSLLLPLIQETANRLEHYNPNDVQTGPAARNDIATIQKHQQLLQANPQLLRIYNLLTASIQKMYA